MQEITRALTGFATGFCTDDDFSQISTRMLGRIDPCGYSSGRNVCDNPSLALISRGQQKLPSESCGGCGERAIGRKSSDKREEDLGREEMWNFERAVLNVIIHLILFLLCII